MPIEWLSKKNKKNFPGYLIYLRWRLSGQCGAQKYLNLLQNRGILILAGPSYISGSNTNLMYNDIEEGKVIKVLLASNKSSFFLRDGGSFRVSFHVVITADPITSLIARERQAYFTTQHMQRVDTWSHEELSHI